MAKKKPTIQAQDDRKPSQVVDDYWIDAERRDPASYPTHSARGGKWMVFIHVSEVDTWWEKIRQATIEGRLGSSAKVATMLDNPNASNPSSKVICVYTYDIEDKADMDRVRQALRDLGVTQKIPYKMDATTMAGLYSNQGDRKISKRFE